MGLYYDGNLGWDLKMLREEYSEEELDNISNIGKQIGYGEVQRILQILWAKELDEKGYPTKGALFR